MRRDIDHIGGRYRQLLSLRLRFVPCAAKNDGIDELRQAAEAGDDHARHQLASWLSDRRQMGEAITVIGPLADADDDIAQLWLAG